MGISFWDGPDKNDFLVTKIGPLKLVSFKYALRNPTYVEYSGI